MGRKRIAALIAALAIAGAGLGGCGDEPTSETTGSAPDPATALEITVWPEGREAGKRLREEIRCPDGEDEATTRACEAASRVEADELEPTPPGVACTQIFGGPQQARIVGRLHSEAVDATLSRSNGCEIARWEAAQPLLELAWAPA